MNMNLKGIMPTLGAKPGQVLSDPYARAFAPQPQVEVVKEEEDHEVSMAQNSLDTIIKMATELKAKLGENEKDIPAWIQDHITNAENFISQASSNYHEYGTTEIKVLSKEEFLKEGKFKKDDLVYNKRTKTVGIVRLGDDKYGEVKTDADGNVDVDELEKYNPIKHKHHQNAKVAPSTEREVNSRGLFNPFKDESVLKEAYGNDKSMLSLVDILSNSMEDIESANEFVSIASKIPGFANYKNNFKDVYNKYWKVGARERTDWVTKDWLKWLKQWPLEESVSEVRLTDIVRSIVETPAIGKPIHSKINEAKKYDIGSGYMGNGLTIWNRAEEEHGDYKIIAHISPQGKLSVRHKQLPADLKKMFQIWADSMAKGNMGPKH